MIRKTDKIILFLAAFMALGMVVFSVGTLYLMFEPPTLYANITATYATDKAGNIKTEFRPGDGLYYYREGVILRNPPAMAYQTLVGIPSGIIYARLIPTLTVTRAKGPFKRNYFGMVLPSPLPEGNYELQTVLVYQINPLQKDATQIVKAVSFKVVK